MPAINVQGFTRLVVATIGLTAAISSVPTQAAPRPLSDFLEAQGTYCVNLDDIAGCDLVAPPQPNMIHWTGPAPSFNLTAVVDYAGLMNNYLVTHGKNSVGTTVAGQVNERPLPDGRAEVQVTLQTKNALTYLIEISDTRPEGVLVYGHPLPDLLTGARPALSTCSVRATFINTAPGAPLPDLIQVAFFPSNDQFEQSVAISCSGKGALASGGMASFTLRETGTLLRTPGRGANADGFPVELIALHPIGGKSAMEFREAPQQ